MQFSFSFRWLVVALTGVTLSAPSGCGGGAPPETADDTEATTGSSRAIEPMPPEDVLFALRSKQGDVTRCFEVSGYRGAVRTSFRVEPSGEVRRAEIEPSSPASSPVEACLLDVIRGLHFDPRDTTLLAGWTFVRGLADRSVLERAERRSRSKKRKLSPSERRLEEQRGGGPIVDPRSPGTLSTAAIENVAEHGFRLYAFCLRDGLNRNVRLNGRVLLDFSIDPNGHVQRVEEAGSDVPDLAVIDCVAEAFYAMQFPQPSGGSVRLRYSVLLNEE